MPQVEEVVIKIVGDTKQLEPTLKKLKQLGTIVEKDEKKFKAANESMRRETQKTATEIETASKKREFLISRNVKRLKELRIARKKAFNPNDISRYDNLIRKTSKDIDLLRGKTKKLSKESNLFGKTVSRLGPVIVGAFAVHSIINFGKHLLEVAVESEVFEKRARKVFGNSIEIVEEFAIKSALSLGLTKTAFLGAAAAVGDILVPLGLSRKRAAEMSIEAVKLGGALKEFTGDSRSAAEISNIVAKSLTGEVEGLKTLGVVVDQTSKEFKELIITKQNDLGLTRQQAKAEAIFQLAVEGSSDALQAFEENGDSLVRQQAELGAQTDELAEGLATLLTPAYLGVTKAANQYVGSLNKIADAEGSAFEKLLAFVDISGISKTRLVLLSIARKTIATAQEEAEVEEELNRLRSFSIAGLKVLIIQGNELAKQELDRRNNTEDNTKATRAHIKTIGELKIEMTALRSARDSLIPKSKELAETDARISEIQKILKGDTNQLKEAIAALRKEFELSEDQIFGAAKALSAFDQEILRAQALGLDLSDAFAGDTEEFVEDADFLVKKFQESLKGREQALNISFKTGVISEAEFNDEIDKLRQESADKELDNIEELANKRIDALSRVAQAAQQISGILAQLSTNKLIAIDNEEKAQLKSLEAQGLGHEELATQQLTIQQKSDTERSKILTKQAKADKAAAIFDAAINTAISITKAFATLPFPASVVVAALNAALGAAQIAVIASQPIPVFHKGKKSDLQEGEMFAKILKSETVIPPMQSKKHKGLLDAVIDNKLDSYVMKEYMIPVLEGMTDKKSTPFNDVHLWKMQKKQLKEMQYGNALTRSLIKSMDSGNHRRSWN